MGRRSGGVVREFRRVEGERLARHRAEASRLVFNVKADPHVELQDGPVKQDMWAREVTGAEKVRWWERAVAAYPPYAEYQRSTQREIPVFVLEPATSISR